MNLIKKAKKNYERMLNEDKAMKLYSDKYLMGIDDLTIDLTDSLIVPILVLVVAIGLRQPFQDSVVHFKFLIVSGNWLVIFLLCFTILFSGIPELIYLIVNNYRINCYNKLKQKHIFSDMLTSVWKAINISEDEFSKQFLPKEKMIVKLIFMYKEGSKLNFIDLDGHKFILDISDINTDQIEEFKKYNLYTYSTKLDKTIQDDIAFNLFTIKISEQEFYSIYKNKTIMLYELFVKKNEKVMVKSINDIREVGQYQDAKNNVIRKYLLEQE